MTEEQPIVSWTSLEGMEKIMGEAPARALAQKLLGFLEAKVSELEATFQEDDAAAVESCLHKLASNAAALGAMQLSHTARAMERDCVGGKWEDVRRQKDMVLDIAKRSLVALKERLS